MTFMKKHYHTIFNASLIVFGISCHTLPDENKSSVDTLGIKKSADTTFTKKEFGDRLSIIGDFNGDKIIDTLSESYISSLTNRETFKTLDNQDWENNIDLVIKNKPITRLFANIPNVDTFVVTKEFQQAGLFHYRNLGDINNDGQDEIGYAIKWVDNSNLNSYHILGLKDNKFIELFNFSINEALLYGDQEGTFDNGDLIKRERERTILYKFYSDTATLETGKHEFN
jgi:hypothetical protein